MWVLQSPRGYSWFIPVWASRRSGCLCWIFFFSSFSFYKLRQFFKPWRKPSNGRFSRVFSICVPSLKGWTKCPKAHHPPAATDCRNGSWTLWKNPVGGVSEEFKRSSFRKLVFSFWFSSNENGRCFFWKSNFTFRLSGETTAIKKTAPDLRKTYGKRKFPVLA